MEIIKKCEYCGCTFIAHSFNTRFCSKKCTDKAYKNMLRDKRFKEQDINEEQQSIHKTLDELKGKPYLSPREAATLIGVSRATLYRYLATGAIKCLQLRGRTVIRGRT